MIHTVLGPIDAADLGVTSMHEHVLADASALHRPGVEELDPDAAVSAELAGALRWSQLAVRDNLRLDDPDEAAGELTRARRRGLRAVVECSSLGLGPDHARLPKVSRRSGVTIIAAYGAYLGPGVPGWFRELDEDAREELFARALAQGIPGAGYRAGMLGLMGTTAELTGDERATLRAGARAAARHGAAMSIRLDDQARRGTEVLALCEAQGLARDRIVLSNVDEYLDDEYLRDLGQSGAVLEMCFGNEAMHVGRVRNPSDLVRLETLLRLLPVPGTAWVLGCATWTKGQLRRFGGHGYDHLVARVVPALRALGVSDPTLHDMLTVTPARLLDRASG